MYLKLLFFFLLYQRQIQGAKIIGKLDITNDLASVFQEIFDQYLHDNSKAEKTEIDINKLVNSYKDFADNKYAKELMEADRLENVKQLNINLNIGGENIPHELKEVKKFNVGNDDTKAIDAGNLSMPKARRKRRRKQSTQSITSIRKEKKYDELTNEKQLTQLKNAGKDKESKKEEAGRESKLVTENVVNIKKNEHNNQEVKVKREKTILEEMIGMDRSVHVFGKHDKKKDMPLNNIQV